VDQRQQRPVRVRQREEEAAGFGTDVEVPAELQGVQRLERDPEREPEAEGPPADLQVAADERIEVVHSASTTRLSSR
jgi:hypothetical protein